MEEFEKSININFTDKELLKQAFTHRSFVNENRNQGEHNERLEFLGDAVLELVTTDFLFRKYPAETEGALTLYRAALVNTQTLSGVAKNIGIDKYLRLSKGESQDNGRARDNILANTMEALIGSIYLDSGYEKARDFIMNHISPLIEKVVEDESWLDAKSKFQEKAQEATGITPNYETIRESGPDHNKKFVIGVYLNGEEVAQGTGNSKQEAEQSAAQNALEARGW